MTRYVFKERRKIESVLQLIRQSPPQNIAASSPPVADGFVFKTPQQGIPARNGANCGKAACTPYFIDDNGVLTELKGPQEQALTYDIYHIGSTPVSGDAYIQAKRCHGRLVADMEDCG